MEQAIIANSLYCPICFRNVEFKLVLKSFNDAKTCSLSVCVLAVSEDISFAVPGPGRLTSASILWCVPLFLRTRIFRVYAFCVIRNASLRWNFRSESRRNVDNSKFTNAHIINCLKAAWSDICIIKSKYCAMSTCTYVVFVYSHTKTITPCAVICECGLTMRMTTIAVAISLY